MVDVSGKPRVRRTARAGGKIQMQPATLELIRQNRMEKGDVLGASRFAGISAAKATSSLIPLCHNIAIDHVAVDLHPVADGIEVEAVAICTDRTGIEMEALTAVSVACLTLYDMCKAVDKTMTIEAIRLLEKTKEAVPVTGKKELSHG
jgi:cyclic pyranopterin monophosphate synthase